MKHNEPECPLGFFSVESLAFRWKVGRSTIYRWMENDLGRFPKPVKRPRRRPIIFTEASVKAYEKWKGWT